MISSPHIGYSAPKGIPMDTSPHLHEPSARSTARYAVVLRYPRRPSALGVLALLVVVMMLAALSIWERRVFIDAYIRDTSARLAVAADSPYLLAQQPDFPSNERAVPASGITIEPQIAASPKMRAYWGLRGAIAWRLACHAATALFLGLAMLSFLRRWAMPPAASFLLSLLPPALFLFMPGPMAFHLALGSTSTEVLAYAAALLWLDCVLDSRRQDLPVLAMVFEAIVLFLGAWIGPYFWIVAAFIFMRRLVTRRWRTLTSHAIGAAMFFVPTIMGAVASIATGRSLPASPRDVPAMFPGVPGFWGGGMTESFGAYGLAALFVSAACLIPGLLLSYRHARRTSFATSGAWSAATLAGVMIAAPVSAEAFIRLRSTPWDVDTLFYAPTIAVTPFALLPALMWALLPSPSRRWSTTLALITAAIAAAVLVHEHPRYRGLLPQPRLAAALLSQTTPPDPAVDTPQFDLVDFRIRPVDTGWCRAYVTIIALAPPTHDWSLRLRGVVPDDAVLGLPEHQRDYGRAEWMIPLPAAAFPKSPRTLLAWADLAMHDVDYDLSIDLVRTDASGDSVTVLERPLLRIAPFNPWDQRDTCALRNAGFEHVPTPDDWAIASNTASLVKHETDLTFRGTGALRSDPGAYYSIVRQEVHSLASLAGRTVTFSAMARTTEPLTTRLILAIGDTKIYSPCHPGDGGWHKLSVRGTVPRNQDITSIAVQLVHSGKPNQAAVFDEAELHVE